LSESPQRSQVFLHFKFMYCGFLLHSSSAFHAAHFVSEHSPDSKTSKHSSFLSLQNTLSGLTVGNVSMLGEAVGLGAEGFDVIVSFGVSVGEDAELVAAEGFNVLVSFGASVGEGIGSVGSIVGGKVSFLGGDVGTTVSLNVGDCVSPSPLSIGASVGSPSFDPIRSSYGKIITFGSTSRPPSSIALVMADEYALSSCEAYSRVKIFDEIKIDTFVVISTHKVDAGSPMGQSVIIKTTITYHVR